MITFLKKHKKKIITAVVICCFFSCCISGLFIRHAFNYNTPKGHEISDKEILEFPEGFLWGAATASYQVEGGNFNSNWWRFEQKEGTIRDGDSAEVAADHYNRYEEDFDLAKKLNLNSYRFSIEWSRIEPEKGKFDDEEVEHYRQVLQALSERNIKPMVTLWHFSQPTWFEDEGGWENSDSVDYYLEYVEYVVEKLSDEVELWITMNEPMAYITCSYVSAKWAPGKVDIPKVPIIFKNLVRAHKGAYGVIHNLDADGQVGISEHSSFIVPYSDKNVFENVGAYLTDYFWIHYPIEQIVEYVDFLGVHYYYKQEIKTELVRDILTKEDPHKIETQGLGRIYYPPGLYEILLRFKKYDVPIYITEIGIPDGDKVSRDRFVREHVRELYYAIEAGVDVRGIYYWALLDSFEWTEGYDARFGLIWVDFETQERSIKQDAWEYAAIAKCNCVGN